MSFVGLFFICIVLVFGVSVLFGAPYLPTRKSQIRAAFKLLKLKPGQAIIDLGSGDGAVLIEAAKRGYKVIGYELNPVLYLISYIRTAKYRQQTRLYLGNFWGLNWPPADAVFVFLRENYMGKLNKKLARYPYKPVSVASYAFKIENRQIYAELNGVYLYKYK